MSSISQRSFAGGEIAPALYARVDTTKYATGLRTMRNSFIMRHGGSQNRPGSKFTGELKDSSKRAKLVPFIFNSTQAFILEFGDLYMRVITSDGAYITETAKTITGITKANPCVVTSNSHGYSNGDELYFSGIVGMTELNGRNLKVASATTNTYQLTYMDGTVVNSSAFGAYVSGGTTARVYTVTTTYIEDDLQELQYVQSADVITIVHQNYAPREVARISNTNWTISDISFVPSISAPGSVTNSGAAGSTTEWVVTSVTTETYEESIASSSTGSSNTPTSGSPLTVSWAAVTGAIEYNVYKKLNGVYGYIGTSGSTSFIDNGITADTTDTPPVARNPFGLEAAKTITGITQANPAVVTANAHGFSNFDIVYSSGVVGMTQVNGNFYLVNNVTTNTFELLDRYGNNVNSTGYTAYSSGGTVARAHNYPATVSYIQQRLMFANTKNNPETCYGSRTGYFKNFTTSSPTQSDDAVTFTMVGRQVNEVRHLVDLGKLVTFTTAGEWAITGGQDGVIRPAEVNPKQYSYNGASRLPPLVIGGNALYVQARGSVVRDLGFDYQIDGYRGNDLTVFSAHLFDNYNLLDWTYQQIPHSIVWAVRDDGSLIGLTYVREHELVGWHRHDFGDDLVENVCSIPDGNEDAVFVIVKRSINGATKRYVEKFSTRQVIDIKDCVFMDSTLSYDGRNSTITSMTLSGGVSWESTETLTLTASGSFFTSADVGNQIHLTGSDGALIRFSILSYSSATVVTGRAHKDVPASLRSTSVTEWAKAVDQVSGLWHLEGKDVSVLGDGFVVASPNNASNTVVTVTNGAIELDKPYTVIHVGLPYISDLETLDIDSVQGETLADKKKLVSRVSAYVEKSRGMWIGSKPPSDDNEDPLEGLSEPKIRNDENYDDPVALETGVIEVNIRPEWNSNGRVFIRQVDPLPLSVLAIIPAGLMPFRGGA